MGTSEKLAYSITEAVSMAPVSRATLYRWAAEGRINIKRIGNRSFVMADEFDALFKTAENYQQGWNPKKGRCA